VNGVGPFLVEFSFGFKEICQMKRQRKTLGNPAKAVALLRASTADQKASPEVQRQQIEGWASREGVEVVAWHVEQGVSGATPLEQRTGLLAAISDLENRGAGRLVIAKRDRLARDTVIAGLVEQLVARAGAKVVSADGTSNADGPEGVLLRGIADLFGMYERLTIASRTRAALQAKKARGERTGTVPFGFALASDGKTLIESSTEQEVITVVRHLRGQGLSLRGIVRACKERGIASRSGRPLGLVQIDRLLRRVA
jgi:DNA invertase Pin-like site-specific DNA recombinase